MMKLVLFDLDGTLIQSTEVIMETFVLTFKKYFKDVTLDEKTLTSFLGTTLYKTFELYMDDTHDVDELVQFYRHTSEALMKEKLLAYPHAKEVLETLKDQGVRLGVVTSKMREVAKAHLTLVGLESYIEHIVGYEDVTRHKPDKEPLEKALQLFNITHDEAIYIGDHENDMLSAKHARMMCCAVTYSHRLKEMLAVQPDYVIDDLIQILDIV